MIELWNNVGQIAQRVLWDAGFRGRLPQAPDQLIDAATACLLQVVAIAH